MTISDKLAMADDRFQVVKEGRIADELKDLASKRTRTAIVVLLAALGTVAYNFSMSIIQGKQAITFETVLILMGFVLFYVLIVGVGKIHEIFDLKSILGWLDITEKIKDFQVNELRTKSFVEIEIDRLKQEIQMRKEMLENAFKSAEKLFNGEAPSERSDWVPMTESFIKMIGTFDDRLLNIQVRDKAVEIVEKKFPLINQAIETIVNHIQHLEKRLESLTSESSETE